MAQQRRDDPSLLGDNMVTVADLALLLGSWGDCPGCPADFNDDALVDAFDLATLLGTWGNCPWRRVSSISRR